jgi:hypothetical protein
LLKNLRGGDHLKELGVKRDDYIEIYIEKICYEAVYETDLLSKNDSYV